jgi:hypothetical protein
MIMSSTKKNKPVIEDAVNTKIQKQFNIVFSENEKDKSSNEKEIGFDEHDFNFDAVLDDDMAIESNGKKNNSEELATTISLDLATNSAIALPPSLNSSSDDAGTVVAKNELDFDLNFSLEDSGEATIIAPKSSSSSSDDTSGGFVLDELDLAMNLSESTQKTIVINFDKLKTGADGFTLEKTNSSIDLMSTAEAKANIESTIKDILRPKFENTTEMKIPEEGLDLLGDDGALDFGGNTPAESFSLNDIEDNDEDAFSLDGDSSTPPAFTPEPVSNDTNLFDISSIDTPEEVDTNDFSMLSDESVSHKSAESFLSDEDIDPLDESIDSLFDEALDSTPIPSVSPSSKREVFDSHSPNTASFNTEDSLRVQATIRALREEREELLAKIKTFKTDNKELEEDNLTLKANLDEAKIEITILRKRHMVEIEDIKYRLTMSEEKKALAEEKARQAELKKEKLEQKVRIDFNQVKQREKELESKLELLSMDVDSQVQSRDHKILELRRKIDALEFNMENVSIKEQKSMDDKRKLEDRLNKIMQTLRHSIKNLEDDIDHAVEDCDNQKDKN